MWRTVHRQRTDSISKLHLKHGVLVPKNCSASFANSYLSQRERNMAALPMAICSSIAQNRSAEARQYVLRLLV
jgi:hypothetical protein